MKRFIGFIKKEFYHIFRDRRSLFILFGMPIAQILLFGFAITNEINNVDIAILDHSKDTTTEEIINKISASKYFTIKQMIVRETDIEISLFLDPNPKDINLAFELGTDAIELHTGNYANAPSSGEADHELERLKKAAEQAHELGIKVNAGHGLNQKNLPKFIATVPHLNEISIGHALISDAIFDGLETTVKKYLRIIER